MKPIKIIDKIVYPLSEKLIIDLIKTFLLLLVGVFFYFLYDPSGLTPKALIPLLSIVTVLSLILLFELGRRLLGRQTVVKKMKRAGIVDFFFTRNELMSQFSISNLLQQVKPNTEIFVVARSAAAWANEFKLLEDAITTDDIRVTIIMATPSLKTDQIPIKDDWARDDLDGSIRKLNRLAEKRDKSHNVSIYLIPTYVLFSFVTFINNDDEPIGILELGADLPLNRRFCVLCKQGELLTCLIDVYRKLIIGRQPMKGTIPTREK